MTDTGLNAAITGKTSVILVGGLEVGVRELGVDNLETFAAALGAVVDMMPGRESGVTNLISDLLARGPGAVIKGVRVGLRLDEKLMQTMSASELREAIKVLIDLNMDFLSGVLSDLEQAKKTRGSVVGLMSSKPLSEGAIDWPISGAMV